MARAPLRTRRRQQIILIASLITLLYTVWTITAHELHKDHHIPDNLLHHTPTFEAGDHVLLSPQEAQAACRASNFAAYRDHKKGRRKVYDLVLMSTELDWLEIRLQTLSPYVDYFVIVEAPTTFTSQSKPLYLKENWSRFSQFHHKIIHRIVHDPIVSDRIWDHEDWFRDSMLYEVFPGLIGTTQEAQIGDVLLVSDMDEIVRPGAMLILRYCHIPARLIMRTDMFYYSFQWRHHGPQWTHPDATLYKGVKKTLSPNALRQGLLDDGWLLFAAFRRWWDRATLWNAGWHCSSCFATIAEMRTKMHSFSHQSWNTAANRELSTMVDRVRHGLDLFDRDGQTYDRIDNNTDIPTYILEEYARNRRFRYMLDRDGLDAGFEDWQSSAAPAKR
ncbi:hypothetical protein AMS68_007511 [Peltaster fructicola]|uniref:Glycosyl transferase family 17 protein n=1 Tax=Peltaster fructicola TaxID=286661 RepID=A0A6H0Y4Q5_9PEZI|nr:hypothetical protein AMS68_007511 [Peltaster fructicola]